MKLVFATFIRCADRWGRVGITDLERLQLRALRQELGLEPATIHDDMNQSQDKEVARPRIEGGYTRDDFWVDHDNRTVTYPAGHTANIAPKGSARFGKHCGTCSLQTRCTTAKTGRVLRISEHDDELVAARRAWAAGEFTDDYRRYRPMVERSIAWLVGKHHRRLRYRGVEANQAQLVQRVAAINLRRLINLGLTATKPT